MPKIIILSTFIFILASLFVVSEEITKGVLRTPDNMNIAYEHYKKGTDSVVIVCPGFYNSKINRWMRKTVDLLSPHYDVIIFDMRGHGESSGRFTWSSKEHIDINTATEYAVSQGYRHIGILAFSLGAASAINAAAERSDIDSMVLISCPSNFDTINFHFWEPEMFWDLKDNIECKWHGKGANFTHFFMPKKKPIDSIKKIKNTAILFIHGDKDWVIKDTHSKKLYDKAECLKKIEIIKGGLHAERLIEYNSDKMEKLIVDWFSETLK